MSNYVCVHCGKSYTKEATLVAHMCEQKRRALQRDEKRVQAGYMTYNRFYRLTQNARALTIMRSSNSVLLLTMLTLFTLISLLTMLLSPESSSIIGAAMSYTIPISPK